MVCVVRSIVSKVVYPTHPAFPRFPQCQALRWCWDASEDRHPGGWDGEPRCLEEPEGPFTQDAWRLGGSDQQVF